MPKLFIQSRDDIITPYTGAEQLYSPSAFEPKRFEEVRGTHAMAWIADLRYAGILSDFLHSVP